MKAIVKTIPLGVAKAFFKQEIDSSDRALTKQQCAPYATEPFLEMIGTLVVPAPGDIQRAAQLPRAG